MAFYIWKEEEGERVLRNVMGSLITSVTSFPKFHLLKESCLVLVSHSSARICLGRLFCKLREKEQH